MLLVKLLIQPGLLNLDLVVLYLHLPISLLPKKPMQGLFPLASTALCFGAAFLLLPTYLDFARRTVFRPCLTTTYYDLFRALGSPLLGALYIYELIRLTGRFAWWILG
uniref:Uncharacterized protein n=1 Tax=Picea glauca TaxID=3330 RepID=A0A117NHW0_PICGL|nr:hypothetical protein ABT39_MTgene4332 [Picea glauca]QHR88459.1 hypothetical protein Q903MT_gene2472 [Picea sitchensis]